MRQVKTKIILLSLALLFGFSGLSLAQSSWNQAANQVTETTQKILTEAERTENLVAKSREQLTQELNSLKSELQNEQKELSSLKEQFNKLLKQENELRSELKEEEEEIQAVEGTVRSAAKDAANLLQNSPISNEFPQRREKLNTLLDTEHFPGFKEITSLTGMLFREMQASKEIKKYQGDFIGSDGSQNSGQILRIGALTTCYRTTNGHQVGYLKTSAKGQKLLAIPGDLPWSVSSSLNDYFQGQDYHLPLDLSGGAVFQRLVQEKSFQEWLTSGGFLIWPIFFLGLVAFFLVLERLVFMGRIRVNSDRIMSTIVDFVQKGEWQKCQEFCVKNKRFPTCRVLHSTLKHMGASQQVLENALQEAILRQLPRLERFLPTLSVLAAIAPLLGLLGTVTGMIDTFQVITVFGTGDPKLMSGGISEALVTTQLGLAVAVPIMLMHHFLERRVDKIIGDIEEKGTSLTVTLLKNGFVRDKDSKENPEAAQQPKFALVGGSAGSGE
jgi:biopolymer transport protein ExbB